MGTTNPKPDCVVGLSRDAFSNDELELLLNYATMETPVLSTADLCFPFLIFEVENGDEGLNKAKQQNMHSGAIAVRAIHELHRAAYGKSDFHMKELYGKVLVFTIAHDHRMVHIYGHFAVLAAGTTIDTLEFHQIPISSYQLTALFGMDVNKPQNFVRNVYDKFLLEHLEKIKAAASKLPLKPRAGVSFAASVIMPDYSESEEGDSNDTDSRARNSFYKIRDGALDVKPSPIAFE